MFCGMLCCGLCRALNVWFNEFTEVEDGRGVHILQYEELRKEVVADDISRDPQCCMAVARCWMCLGRR